VLAGNDSDLFEREVVAERVYEEMAAYLKEIAEDRSGSSLHSPTGTVWHHPADPVA